MQLSDLKDLYKGTMAFVVGAGPSLHFQNVELLRDYCTIAVNSGFLKVKDFCEAFVADDRGLSTWSYYLEDLKKSDCIKLLYEEKLRNYASHLNNVVFFDHKWWHSPADNSYNHDGLIMDKNRNPYKKIIGARTTMGSAVNWAYNFGCDPIVLLAADCCFDRGGQKRYYWQFKGEQRPYRIGNNSPVFTTPNYGVKEGFPVCLHSIQFLDYWQKVKLMNPDAPIINASGGILEAFPRMSLKEVLEKYGDRKKPKEEKTETQPTKEQPDG